MKTTENTVVDYSLTVLEECGLMAFKAITICVVMWLMLHIMAYASLYALIEHKDAICYSGL